MYEIYLRHCQGIFLNALQTNARVNSTFFMLPSDILGERLMPSSSLQYKMTMTSPSELTTSRTI